MQQNKKDLISWQTFEAAEVEPLTSTEAPAKQTH